MKVLITSPALSSNSGMSTFVSGLIKLRPSIFNHVEIGGSRRSGNLVLNICRQIYTFARMAKISSIVHINAAFDYGSLFRDLVLVIIAKCHGKRVIVHMHGGRHLERAREKWLVNALFNLFVRYADCIIVLSDRELQKLNLRCDKSKIVRNSVEFSHKKVTTFNGLRNLKVVYIGRLDLNKGILDSLKAIESLSLKGYSIEFDMYGDGPAKSLIEREIQELSLANVRYRGSVTGYEKAKILEGYDVFLMPSYFEGLPFALLETMALGIIPITTGVGSICDVVQDNINGLLVPTHSPASIVAAFEKILIDPTFIRSLSDNAHKTICDSYLLKENSQTLFDIYNKLNTN